MTEDHGWVDVGEHLRQARLAMDMSQAELGVRVGLERTMIAKIEAGTRRVDALELARLAAVLQVSMDSFLRPQPAVLSRRATAISEDSDTEVGRESWHLEQALGSWVRDLRQLVDLGLLQPRPILNYTAAVESVDDARKAARWARRRLGLKDEPIDTLVDFCERAGQHLLVTELPGDGASLVDGELAAAIVSMRGDPGRRRATAAHELGHMLLGDEYSADLGANASRADRERIIDAFAAELLLPIAVVASTTAESGHLSRDDLVRLAATYRTSWSLALKQADAANVLSPQDGRRWNQSRPTKAEFLEAAGWAPLPDLESVRVPPKYSDAVMRGWRSGFITGHRVLELMHGQLDAEDLPDPDEPDIKP